jgi:ABC-type amino acid transport substrate-binding protein
MENNYAVKSFTANSDAELALVGNKVAAWVIDDLTAKEMVDAYNAENPAKKLVILDEAMTTEPYAFAFAQGNEDLVNKINEILEGLLADGTVASIFAQNNAPYTAP